MNLMQPYHDLLSEILEKGIDLRNERTGEVCRYLVGRQLKFDLAKGFPVPTTKKFAFKTMVAELLGFFRGYTNSAQFEADGCKIWRANADTTPAWIANPYRKGDGDMGRAYPVQWTSQRDARVAIDITERDRLAGAGYAETLFDAGRGAWLMERSINQVENCLMSILTNPTSRQNVLSGWRADEIDMTCLPPCHLDYIWTSDPERRVLHLTVTQRSWDCFLAFNIQTAALFLEIMAKLAGYRPGELTLQVTNVHIYSNHFDVTREQLSRDHFDPPRLSLGESIPRSVKPDQVRGIFSSIQAEDIQLVNYQCHGALKAPMAA